MYRIIYNKFVNYNKEGFQGVERMNLLNETEKSRNSVTMKPHFTPGGIV